MVPVLYVVWSWHYCDSTLIFCFHHQHRRARQGWILQVSSWYDIILFLRTTIRYLPISQSHDMILIWFNTGGLRLIRDDVIYPFLNMLWCTWLVRVWKSSRCGLKYLFWPPQTGFPEVSLKAAVIGAPNTTGDGPRLCFQMLKRCGPVVSHLWKLEHKVEPWWVVQQPRRL